MSDDGQTSPAVSAICVFCGSAAGLRPIYAESARRFGHLLAQRQVTLVYGGGKVGLMGQLADGVLAGGGRAIGVIPRALVEREVAHQELSELHIVNSMHERKALMARLADAFVALPGGLGTLDELFEIWTWFQLGIHKKPIAVLNVHGFFDPLLMAVSMARKEGFVRDDHSRTLVVSDNPLELLAGIDGRARELTG
jgi:hypothetical protein